MEKIRKDKRIVVFITAALFLSFILVVPAYAKLGSQSFGNVNFKDNVVTEAEIEVAKSDPGILPDHPFYLLKRATEGVRLFLAFDNEEKARLHLEFAKVRLAEVGKLAELNRTDQAANAANDFSKELNETKIGKNISEEAEELVGRSSIVLSLVLEKSPLRAKPAIARALNISIERNIEIRAEIENKTPEEIRTEIKEENPKAVAKIKKQICMQVIQPAIREGICQIFPTPCDVPEGWKKVERCIVIGVNTNTNSGATVAGSVKI